MERSGNCEDEDFICYLEYAHKFSDKLTERVHVELGKAWLNKLMEVPRSVPEKRNRNVFLSRLVLAMQTGELQKPFLKPPPTGPLPNAFEIFGPPQPEIEDPDDDGAEDQSDLNTVYVSKDGRTYVATKSLGKGLGALTYMGVSVADVPEWRGRRPCDPDDVFNAHFNPAPKRAAFTVTTARSPPYHRQQHEQHHEEPPPPPPPPPPQPPQQQQQQQPQSKPSKVASCCCASKKDQEVMQLRGGANGLCQLYCDGQHTESWSDDTGDTVSVCEYYTSQMRNIDDYLDGKCCLDEDLEHMARDIQESVTGHHRDYVDNVFVLELRNALKQRFHSIQQQGERLNSLTEAAEQRLEATGTSPRELFQKVWSEAAADEALTASLRRLENVYSTDVKNKFLDILKKLKMNLVEKGKECVEKEWTQMCNSHQQRMKRLEDKIKTANDILETATRDLETICAGLKRGEGGDEKPEQEMLMLQELSKLVDDHKAGQEEVDRLERLVLVQGGKLNQLVAQERLLNESNGAIKSEMKKMVEAHKP